jgi:polysaccharide biosynthesis protein PslH
MAEILFLAHRVPWPPDRGDKIRSWNILKHLHQRHAVHVATFTEGENHAAAMEALEPITASVTLVRRSTGRIGPAIRALVSGQPASVAAFDSPIMTAAVEDIARLRSIGTVYVFSSQMAQHVARFHQPIIMDFVDVDSAKFSAYAKRGSVLLRPMLRREARLLLAHDLAVAIRARASLFVSEAEAALFRELGGEGGIRAVGNGIDAAHFDPVAVEPQATAHPTIAFTGQMDYPPNVAAVSTFVEQVLPQLPGVTFAIVGRNPTPAVQALAKHGDVIVTGEVPDTRPWLAAADVIVAPLAIARGVQNKVLEAMAMARPIVASSAAADGIAHAGTIKVADSSSEQAEAIRELLGNSGEARRLGQAARVHVIAAYGWDAQLAPLDELLR